MTSSDKLNQNSKEKNEKKEKKTLMHQTQKILLLIQG